MNNQLAPLAFPTGQPLLGLLEEQPLDTQVQYLKQVIFSQQLMLENLSNLHNGLEMQSRQLQVISQETLLAANDRIDVLERALNTQNLKAQASLLTAENAHIRSQIEQLKVLHEAAWMALLETTSTKMKTVASKIECFIQELEHFSASTKEKAEWYGKIRPKGSCKADISALLGFLQAYPHLGFQDAFNARCEYDTTFMYSKGMREHCLAFIDDFDMGSPVGHPLYKKGSIIRRLQMHSTSQLEVQPNEATLAKITHSNADLKAMKDDLQMGHINHIKAHKVAVLCTLEPTLNNIEHYIEKNLNEISILTEAIPTRCQMEQIAWKCGLQKKQFIENKLHALHLEIKKICLEFKG